jgi:hypothetical protein
MGSVRCLLFEERPPPLSFFSAVDLGRALRASPRPLFSRLCWDGTSSTFKNQKKRSLASLKPSRLPITTGRNMFVALLCLLQLWQLVSSQISTAEIDSQGQLLDLGLVDLMVPPTARDIFKQYKIFSTIGKGKGMLNHPIGVTYCDHLIFVADADNHRIQAFRENGTFAFKIGGLSAGYAIGEQFKFPHGLSCYNGLLYVADTENSRIQIFHTNGTYVNMFARRSDCHYAELGFPHSCVVCDGIVTILDTYNHRMQLFSMDVSRIRRIGSKGDKKNFFEYPEGIACGNHSLFVADTQNHRIQVFTADGEFLRFYELISNMPTAVAVCNGRLFVNDPEYHRITEYSLWTGEFIVSIGSEGRGRYQFKGIEGLFCSDGVLFATDYENHRVHIIPFQDIIDRELQEGFRLDPDSGATISSEYGTTEGEEGDEEEEEEGQEEGKDERDEEGESSG